MKRIVCMLLVLSILSTIFSACNNEPSATPDVPEEPEVVAPIEPNEPEPVEPDEPVTVEPETPIYTETEVGAENTLNSKGETVTLNVVDNILYITNLSTLNSNVNLLSANSPFALPKSYQTDFPSKETFDLNWVYTSAVKFENKEVNDIMTSGLIYNFEDTTQNVKLRVYCVIRNDIRGPFEFYMEVENLNDSAFRIAPYDFATFTVDIPDPETTSVVQIKREGWLAEGFRFSSEIDTVHSGMGIYKIKFADIKRRTSNATTDGSEDYLLAQYIDNNSENGLFYALEWTNGNIRVINNNDSTATVNINMDIAGKHTRFFTTEIPAKETFVLPSVYLMPYDGSIDDGSNVYKNWFFECKTVSTLRDNPAEPLTQIDFQMSEADAAAVNLDSIKYDYGWWSNVNFHASEARPFESTWTLLAEEKDAPGHRFIDMLNRGLECEKQGLNFTVYILLHDNVDADGNVTDQYGELNSITHPEWFSDEKECGNYLVDLGNVDAVEYLKNTLANFFIKTKVDTWRTDFQPMASTSDKENRHDANGTDVQYWTTVGFGEILDHLYDAVEGFRYECCDCGGESKSIYLATKAVVFNVEDSATYINLRAAFYDSSYVLHPAQLQFPCNIASFNPESEQYFCPDIPEPTVAEGDTYDFYDSMQHMGFRTTIMGVPHWAPWDGNVLPDYYKEYCDMYEAKVRPLVREAELYHILPRPDGTNWDGMMYADPDSENEIKGLVFLFKPSVEVSDTYNVVFDGLYEDTVYQLTFEDRPEQNCTATGADLMTKGIEVEIKYVGSELIWITEAN